MTHHFPHTQEAVQDSLQGVQDQLEEGTEHITEGVERTVLTAINAVKLVARSWAVWTLTALALAVLGLSALVALLIALLISLSAALGDLTDTDFWIRLALCSAASLFVVGLSVLFWWRKLLSRLALEYPTLMSDESHGQSHRTTAQSCPSPSPSHKGAGELLREGLHESGELFAMGFSEFKHGIRNLFSLSTWYKAAPILFVSTAFVGGTALGLVARNRSASTPQAPFRHSALARQSSSSQPTSFSQPTLSSGITAVLLSGAASPLIRMAGSILLRKFLEEVSSPARQKRVSKNRPHDTNKTQALTHKDPIEQTLEESAVH